MKDLTRRQILWIAAFLSVSIYMQVLCFKFRALTNMCFVEARSCVAQELLGSVTASLTSCVT